MTDTSEDLVARIERVEQRAERVEKIVVARSHKNDTPEVKEIVSEIVADFANTPNAEGHSPNMLEDWQEMVDAGVAEGKTPEQADTDLDNYFTDIQEGRRDSEGTWIGEQPEA